MATIGEKLAAALAGELVVAESVEEGQHQQQQQTGRAGLGGGLVEEQLAEATLLQSLYDALLSSGASIDFSGQGLRDDFVSVFKAYTAFPHEVLAHQNWRAFCRDAQLEKTLATVELDLVWTRVKEGELRRFSLPALKTKGLSLEHFAWAFSLALIEIDKRKRGPLSGRAAAAAELIDEARKRLNAKSVKHFVDPTADPAPLLSDSGLEATRRAAPLIESLFFHYSEGPGPDQTQGRETMLSPLIASPQQHTKKAERRASRTSFSVSGSGTASIGFGGSVAASPTAASQAGRMSIFGGAGQTARTGVTFTQGSRLQQTRASSVIGSAVFSLDQRVMSFESLSRFLADFDVVPSLITKRQLSSVFASTAKRSAETFVAGASTIREEDDEDEDGAGAGKEAVLSFPAFLEAFGRIGLTAYGPASKHGDAFPSAGKKIDAFCDRLLSKRELLDAIVVKQKKDARRTSGFLAVSPLPASVNVGSSLPLSSPPLSSSRRHSTANQALVSGALGSAFTPGNGGGAFPVRLVEKVPTPPSVPGLNLTAVSPGPPPLLAVVSEADSSHSAGQAAVASAAIAHAPAAKSPPPPPPRLSFRGDAQGSGRGVGSPPPPNPPPLGAKDSIFPLPSTPTGSSTARSNLSMPAERGQASHQQRTHYEGDVYGYDSARTKRDSGRSTDSEGKRATHGTRRHSSGSLPPEPVSARSVSPTLEQPHQVTAIQATLSSPFVNSPPPPPPPSQATLPSPPLFSPSPRMTTTARAPSTSCGRMPALEPLPEHAIEDEEASARRRASLAKESTAAQRSPTAMRRAPSADLGAVDSLSSYSLLDSASAMLARGGQRGAGSVRGDAGGAGTVITAGGRRTSFQLGHKDFALAGSLAASQVAAATGVVLSPPTAGAASAAGGGGLRRASTTMRRATVDSASPIPIPIRPLKAQAAASDAVEKGLATRESISASPAAREIQTAAALKEAATGYRVDPVIVERLKAELESEYMRRLQPLFTFYSTIRDPLNRGSLSVVNFFRLLKDIGDVLDASVTAADVQLQVSLVLSRSMMAAKGRMASSAGKLSSSSTFARASASGAASHRPSFSRSLSLPQFFECLARVSELIRKSVTPPSGSSRGGEGSASATTPSALVTRRSASADRALGRRASLSASSAATQDLLRYRRPSFGLKAFVAANSSNAAASEAALLQAIEAEERRKREEKEQDFQAARAVFVAFVETRVLPLYAASGFQEAKATEAQRLLFKSDPALADVVSEHAPFLVRVFKHYSSPIQVLASSTSSGAVSTPPPSPPILTLFLPAFLELMKDLGLAPGLLSFLEVEHFFLDTARRAGTGGSTASLAFVTAATASEEREEDQHIAKSRGLFAVQDAKDEKRGGSVRKSSPSPSPPGFESQRRGGGRVFDEAAFAKTVARSPSPSPTSSLATKNRPLPVASASFDAMAARRFIHSGAFLNFFPFVEAFSALGIIAFFRPFLAEYCPTPSDKLQAMLHWCYSAVGTMSKIKKAEMTSRAAGKTFTLAQLTGEASERLAAVLERTGRLVRLSKALQEDDESEEDDDATAATASPQEGVPVVGREDVRAAAVKAVARREDSSAAISADDSSLDLSEATPQKLKALVKALATGDKRWLKAGALMAAAPFLPADAAKAKEREAKSFRVTLFQDSSAGSAAFPPSPLHPARASHEVDLSAFTYQGHQLSHQVSATATTSMAAASLLSPEPHDFRPTLRTKEPSTSALSDLSAIADLPLTINELLAALPSSSASSSAGSFSSSGDSATSFSAESRRNSANTARNIDGCVQIARVLKLDALQCYLAAQHSAAVTGLLSFPSAGKKRFKIGQGQEEDEDFLQALAAAVNLTMDILRHNRPAEAMQAPSRKAEEERENMLLLLSDALIIHVLNNVSESLFRIASVGEDVKEATAESMQRRDKQRQSVAATQASPGAAAFMVAPVMAPQLKEAIKAQQVQRKTDQGVPLPHDAAAVSQELEAETRRLLLQATTGTRGGRGYALLHPRLFTPGELQFLSRQAKGRDARASLSPDKGVIVRSANLLSPKRPSSAGGPTAPVPTSPDRRQSRHSLRVEVASVGGSAETRPKSVSPQGRYSPGRLSFHRPPNLFAQSPKAQAAGKTMTFTTSGGQRRDSKASIGTAWVTPASFLTPPAPVQPLVVRTEEEVPRAAAAAEVLSPYGHLPQSEPKPLAKTEQKEAKVTLFALAAEKEEDVRAKRLELDDFGASLLSRTRGPPSAQSSPSALLHQKALAARLSLPSPRQTGEDTVMLLRARDGVAKFANRGRDGSSANNIVTLRRAALRSPTTAEAIGVFNRDLRKSGPGATTTNIFPATFKTRKPSPAAARSPRLSALMLAAGMKAGSVSSVFDLQGGGTRSDSAKKGRALPAPYSRAQRTTRAQELVLSAAKREEQEALRAATTRQTPFRRAGGAMMAEGEGEGKDEGGATRDWWLSTACLFLQVTC